MIDQGPDKTRCADASARSSNKVSAGNAAVRDTQLSFIEQVGLLALLISMVAMAIDAILPALPDIGRDLAVQNANAPQFLISALLIGLSLGQLVYGPISDSFGRRGPILAGLAIFLLGTVVCLFSSDFTFVLFGRVLQGVGAAGPRVVAVALVRDSYSGAQMARIMSFVMAIFIIVPAIGPAIGELVLLCASWRQIFTVLFVHAGVAVVWFALRQPETHPPSARRPISLSAIGSAMGATLSHPIARNYAIAAGFVFGSFVGFLTSIQQIFADVFGEADYFAAYFAVLALAIGAASVTNSQLVLRLGMQRLCRSALWGLIVLAVIALSMTLLTTTAFPLWLFMLIMIPVCFCFGILFGNFNALAMEPLGHIAGTASAMIASVTSILAVTFGTLVGQAFNGTVVPLFLGFLLAALSGLLLLEITERVRTSS